MLGHCSIQSFAASSIDVHTSSTLITDELRITNCGFHVFFHLVPYQRIVYFFLSHVFKLYGREIGLFFVFKFTETETERETKREREREREKEKERQGNLQNTSFHFLKNDSCNEIQSIPDIKNKFKWYKTK